MDLTGLYDHACNLIRSIYDNRITAPAVLDTQVYFPNAPRFVDRWQEIRDEALSVARTLHKVPRFHDLMPEQEDISANDGRDWRMFIFKAYGLEVQENLARCSSVASILAPTPEVVSAAFSFLAPHKHIPRHRGPFRGVLRFHLGLSMPRAADGTLGAVLEVDGLEYRLDDGDCMLWDDTYPHEAWNNSDTVRVALLLDVWRRDMPLDMELLSRGLVSLVQVGSRWRGVSYSG
jgi:aspartate beta-hydroxylase